jgi:Cu(I)/Ag(I) efflux system membrane fusion protein
MEVQTNLSLKPGMQAVAQLTQSNLKACIPIDAVIRDENATIFSKKAMVCMKMMVETGAESNGTIEIKTALDPTKKVVITGAISIAV